MVNENCKICGESEFYTVKFNNLYLRTDSYNKDLHHIQPEYVIIVVLFFNSLKLI